MKKLTKRLALATQTVRVLSGSELDSVAGGGDASPTTTILNHSRVTTKTIPCRLTGGVNTAPCRYPG